MCNPFGNLFGGGGSSPTAPTVQPAGGQTITNTTTPWSGQQPYLLNLYGKAQNVGNTPLSYYPGQTYASPTTQQNQAIDLTTQRALAGSPVIGAADTNATDTLNGTYLNGGNPGYQDMVTRLGQSIQPNIDAEMSAAGRTGSGANASAYASALANAAGNLGYQNYSDERNNQLKAGLLAPTLANQDYVDLNNLGAAGAQRQAFNQLPITQAVNAYNFNQDAPYIQANRMAGLLGGAIPGGGTSSTQYYAAGPSQVAQGLSLGNSGVGFLNGMGVGNGPGGLLGSFGF